jgi:ArsR family transcriptional regulator
MISRPNVLDHLTALADPTRSRIMLLLDRHELTVGELCTVLQLPQSTVSRHLKILSDEGWIVARGEGTSRFYSMLANRLDAGAQQLWGVVREQMTESAGARQDRRRVESVLAQRREKMIKFFDNSAGMWDELRSEMIGERTDLLALLDLIDESWVVGDLGCGTGHVSEALAQCVRQVIAVDESGPMLAAAERRLQQLPNVELRAGTIEKLPIEDATLDAAILFLVAHFITDPFRVMTEILRVLKPAGKLIVVDLMAHERAEYVVQLGHVWQGFDGEQMKQWLSDAGFERCRYRALPADPAATGPALFVASGRRSAAESRTSAGTPDPDTGFARAG